MVVETAVTATPTTLVVDQHADLILTAKLAEKDGLTEDAKNARARAQFLEEEAVKNAAE
jgi:hypothetical protein